MSRIKFNVITIALALVLCIALVFALGFGVNGGTIATAGGLDNTGIDNGGSSITDKGDIGGGLISGGGDEDDKTIDAGGGSLIDKGDIGGISAPTTGGDEEETAAAKIGDVKYDTIEEALSAANNNDKIYLLKNVALSEDVTISKYLDVYAGGFTFDLCGKKVIGSEDGIRLDFFENVTIKDSSQDKSGAFDCRVKFYLPESGHVIMGGTFNNYTTFSSLMTVKGGVFKSNVELPSNNNGDIKFYGGTFEKGIFKNGYEFADLIGSGCEYRDIQTSAVINVSELKNSVPFKVVCDHTWASGVCSNCGYVCLHENRNGTTCSDCESTLLVKIENSTATRYFSSITAAFSALSDGDTIIVLNDFTMTESVQTGKNVTFDLNGKKITANINGSPMLKFNGKTIVKDSSANKAGEVNTWIQVECKVALGADETYCCYVESGYFSHMIQFGSNTLITGGTYSYASPSMDATNVKVEGGTFNVVDGESQFSVDSKSLTISGGTFNSQFYVASSPTSITITGGTFAEIYIPGTEDEGVELHLSGGTFNSISAGSYNYANFLVEGFVYKNVETSEIVAPENMSANIKVAVVECPHSWTSGVCTICKKVCSHSGGTATCTAIAICETCGLGYGELNSENHSGEEVWTKNESKHSKEWNCCHESIVAEEDHEWNDGVCTECNYVCEHNWIDGTCDYCEKNCEHDWENGVCKICEKVCAHSGGTATCTAIAICETCGLGYGELNSENHSGEEVWTKNESKHSKEWNCCHKSIVAEEDHEWDEDGVCTECDYHCAHVAWTDGICNNCGKNCEHDWENGVCTICEKVCSHSGGAATCKDYAICDVCGLTYGDYDKNNHVGEQEWITTETTHKKTMNCCGDTIIPEEDHEWDEDGVCTECDYHCAHVAWTDGICNNCGKNCKHNWENGVCKICEKVCAHTGGTATCIEKAICEICGEEYGAYDENCHAHLVEVKATASTVTTAGNIAHYHCTDCDKRFSDVLAINEVTLESVALPKLPPAVVSGGEGKYVKNSGESLTVKSNALLSDFVAVYVDGKEISSDNYVLGEDGLSVKFKSAYLDSCEVGTHEVSVRSISGNADTTFTIESAPDEGLSGGAWAGIGIAIAAAVIGAMMGIMLVAKKRG